MNMRTWTWVGAVAAMLTAACTGVRAQDTPAAPATPDAGTGATGTTSTDTNSTGTTTSTSAGTTSTGTTSTTTSTGVMSSGGDMSGGMGMGTPDYSLLADQTLNYTDIMRARSLGLTMDQVAAAYNISRLTGMSLRDVTDALVRGTTFWEIAYEYNIPPGDIFSVDDSRSRIASYIAAYEMTGWAGYQRTPRLARDTELDSMIARVNGMLSNLPQAAGPSTVTFSPNPPGFGLTSPYPAPAAGGGGASLGTTSTRTEASTETSTTGTAVTAPGRARTVKTVTRVTRVYRAQRTPRPVRHYSVHRTRRHQVHHVLIEK